MDWIQTIIIAIVEGLTEFLPVSSTGHMIIAESLLNVDTDSAFVNAFTVIIQFGAILSVICLYWRRFFYPETMRTKGYSWWQAIWRFYLRLIVGVLPAVVLGLAFNDAIEENLGNVTLVAAMLIVGGVFMLFCDRLFNKGSEQTALTYRRAFIIGVIQCISMIPGVSRSMATIVGGMSQRLTRKAAAEFSFFLAVPTMFGATCLELYKLISAGDGNILTQGNNLSILVLGSVVAFVVSIAAIRFFIGYVARYGFKAFGWYRIVVGTLILLLGACGYSLQMVA
jgi:undecaprenyl-diphosphatase